MRASGSQMRERWVQEKGLPRSCRTALAAHLGQRLLLATDLTAVSRQAESRAMQIAEERGARLLILATVPSHAAGDRAASTRLRALTRHARRRGIDAAGRLAAGDPGDCILEGAAAFGADGIVMASGHRPAAGCPCGHVISRARCPVLVTHAA